MALSQQLSQLRSELSRLGSEVQTLGSRISDRVAALDGRIASLGEPDPDLTAEVETLKTLADRVSAIGRETSSIMPEPAKVVSVVVPASDAPGVVRPLEEVEGEEVGETAEGESSDGESDLVQENQDEATAEEGESSSSNLLGGRSF